MQQKRGRYAPSPTGYLHVGNARTALVAWLSVRSAYGRCIWRLEDLDKPRVVPGMAEAAEEDLHWLGLDWDEGLTQGGPFKPYTQSLRHSYYEQALKVLHDKGYLFPCSYSRKDIQHLSTAPHGPNTHKPYPISLRPDELQENWFSELFEEIKQSNKPTTFAAIRFKVPDQMITFKDRVYGLIEENVLESVGDFVLKRRDGMYAYQLAVVVDDVAMEISEVVRGTDLLASTARQILLIQALGGIVPEYAHVPLVRNASGEKLSKRDESLTLRALRAKGVTAEQLLGYMAHSLGLVESLRSCTVQEVLDRFAWDRIKKEDFILPTDFVDQLKKL
ncbi:MAG: tRNA glutamyl-Q(34) synthetase GluQRS [Rhodothermaceae bacterium]|nr:tRNA glutamyl-Q(34) synthetase GluQRS [Rhodothermaceae bacterium]